MTFDIKVIKSLLLNKNVYPTVIVVTLDVILLGILIFYGFKLQSRYDEMLATEEKVQKMKATITLIRNNRNLFSGDTEKYNTILESLIPEEESYFNVITALENLTQKTGVVIDSYSVNLSSTTEEKLTLKVDITGDETSIQKFIQEYKYASGRLITTEEMEINSEKLDSLSFSVNFYHNKFKDTVSPDSKVMKADLIKLDEIEEQL